MTTLTALRRTPVWHFVRHYLEMVAAMLIGMAVLGPLESLLLNPFGWAELRGQVELRLLVMATNMTVAMVAWMRFRGYGWGANAEMAAAMYGDRRTATAMADRRLTEWLRRVHETTRWTTSVCTGAMILAAAGRERAETSVMSGGGPAARSRSA